MINDGLKFKPVLVSDYIDWGTKEDWFKYVRQYGNYCRSANES